MDRMDRSHVVCHAMQGETPQEMAGLAEAMQTKAVPVHTSCDGTSGLTCTCCAAQSRALTSRMCLYAVAWQPCLATGLACTSCQLQQVVPVFLAAAAATAAASKPWALSRIASAA